MRFVQTVTVAALALALCACATKWEKPGSTQQDLAADQAFCENAAENEYANRDEGRLQSWATSLDKRGFYERCMIAHGWGTRA
jgi:hypothetical protein